MGLLHETKNFYKKGMMATCSAENSEEQKGCEFYEEASTRDRCMYLKFDEYCDCLKAQIDSEREK